MDIQTKPGIVVATPAQPFPDFGKWLTYNESVKSATAIRLGIKNVPTLAQYQNMVQVYKLFYAPACEHFGRKLPVSSFFRSVALNKAIGGALNSAHLTGCAIDIDCDGIGIPTNKTLFDYFRQSARFDQLIAEAPNSENVPSWVHIAINRNGESDRSQVMVMKRVNGKTIYENV